MLKKQSMLRKESHDGVGFSVVELLHTRHIFAAAVPRHGGTLEEQAYDALRTIKGVLDQEGPRGAIVKQEVFLADVSQVETMRAIMRDFYGDNNLPATTYVPQHPCSGRLLSIEAMGLGQVDGRTTIQHHDDGLVVTCHDDMAWVHCGQITPSQGAGVHERSLSAFGNMRCRLESVGARFGQILRTWLYLGDIVGPEGDTQRYKELNRARTDFFQGLTFAPARLPDGFDRTVYPASTGIGADNRDVVMSCAAFVTHRDDIRMVPLENPNQTAAYDYSGYYSPKSPKFSRAMALSCGPYATVFISGTASITDSETRHIGDVEGQTRQTLDNIEALISGENLAQHGLPGLRASLEDLAGIRVYIKNAEDYEKTRRVCEQRLGELPAIYAVADVCRPDLLVEIEGIAFAQRVD